MLIKNSYGGLLRFRTKFLFKKSDKREREKERKGKTGPEHCRSGTLPMNLPHCQSCQLIYSSDYWILNRNYYFNWLCFFHHWSLMIHCLTINFKWPKNKYHRITKYIDLEGTHKDPWGQLLALYRTIFKNATMCLRAWSKYFGTIWWLRMLPDDTLSTPAELTQCLFC